MKSKTLPLLSVVLPLLVMAGWVATIEWNLQSGQQVEFAVGGYDPRDLLSGHFVTYAVDYGSVPPCAEDAYRTQEQCVCLTQTPSSTLWTATSTFSCDGAGTPPCEVFIKGQCRYRRFVAGIERLYIPESYSSQLAVLPPASTIRVRVSKSGLGRLETLLIGGRPYQEALTR